MGWNKVLAKNRKYIIVVLASLLILAFAPQILSVSYTTAYEGAKARYAGVYDNEYGLAYTSLEKHSASLATFDTTMRFDRDGYYDGMCNVHGEMTAVQLPLSENKWVPPDWVPTEWWRDSLYWENPRNRYSWHIANSDGTYTVYVMEEWVTKWFISLSAEWDSGPDLFNGRDEAENRRYRVLDVWVEFDTEPVWYFEGQDKAYFAIAKVELSNFKSDGSPRVTPMSPGSALTIYTSPFGQEKAQAEGDFTAFYYQNKTLNPQYFRDKVYVHISLDDFGTSEWWEFLSLVAKGDVVTMGFTVVQFVVGEWKVQDVQNVDDYQGKDSKKGGFSLWEAIADWLNGVGSWFSSISPWTWLGLGTWGLGAIAVIAIVVMVLLFGPSILLRWIPGRKKKG